MLDAGPAALRHSGSRPGYKAHIAYVPERDLAIAVLSNREDTCGSRSSPPPSWSGRSVTPSLHPARCRSRHAAWRPRRAGPTGLTVQYGLGFDRDLVFALQAIVPDVFLARPSAPGVAHRHVFRFERDGTGRVVAARVTMERLKDVRLPRRSDGSGFR